MLVLICEPTLSHHVQKSVSCIIKKLPLIHFGELLAMIGLDESDKRVFDQYLHHKSPEGDLHGDQIFTLAGMELTLDCK